MTSQSISGLFISFGNSGNITTCIYEFMYKVLVDEGDGREALRFA